MMIFSLDISWFLVFLVKWVLIGFRNIYAWLDLKIVLYVVFNLTYRSIIFHYM